MDAADPFVIGYLIGLTGEPMESAMMSALAQPSDADFFLWIDGFSRGRSRIRKTGS